MVLGPTIICPVKIGAVAVPLGPLPLWYKAKLCGIWESLLSKFMVTAAPAGTVIVLMLKAMFSATRSIVTDFAEGEVDVVVEVVVEVGAVVDVVVVVVVVVGITMVVVVVVVVVAEVDVVVGVVDVVDVGTG